MRVAVVTDPPTIVRFRKRQPPEFAGNYSSIHTLRRVLEEASHHVDIFIGFGTRGFIREKVLQERTISGMRLDQTNGSVRFALLVESPPNALIFALKRDSLQRLMPQVLREQSTKGMLAFVSTGPASSSFLAEMASKFQISIHRLDRPGVARITNIGLRTVIKTLGTYSAPSSSSSSSPS